MINVMLKLGEETKAKTVIWRLLSYFRFMSTGVNTRVEATKMEGKGKWERL